MIELRAISIGVFLTACSLCDATSFAQTFQPDEFDDSKVLGYEQCVKCHTQQIEVLKQHPHFNAKTPLHRRPEAIEMARKLGFRSVKRTPLCMQCHYTAQRKENRWKAISGVSCESCHGPSADWIAVHNDYGGPHVTKASETNAHKQQRIATSIERGFRHPSHLYLLARSCFRCHVISHEQLVNVGGHPSRSKGFDFVAWSQGSMRHNFFRSDGQSNMPSKTKRLRVMHLVGRLADMEHTLRATANATERKPYAFQHAGHAFSLRQEIAEIASQLGTPNVVAPGFLEASQIANATKLNLENGAGMLQAANRLSQLNWQLSRNSNGESLDAIDAWLPKSDAFVGQPILRVNPRGN